MNKLDAIATLDLVGVTGGFSGSAEVQLPGGSGGKVAVDAPERQLGSSDPDRQLRCYKQVADQAHFYDSSNKIMRQQQALCGPPQLPAVAPAAATKPGKH